jgi:hypothetical protein
MKTRRHKLRKSRKTRSKQIAGVRSNLSLNEKKNLRAVLLYERSPQKRRVLSGNTLTIDQRIAKLIEKQPPLKDSMIVWRGQLVYKILPDWTWFSTSLRKDVATSYATKFLFKIHLQPGVKVLDVYKYYNEHEIKDPVKEVNDLQENYFQHNNAFTNNDYTQFQEVLVQAKGSFWQDPEKTVEGFKLIGKTNPVDAGTLEEIDVEGNTDIMKTVYETYYFPSE